jgi:hypothetical protein
MNCCTQEASISIEVWEVVRLEVGGGVKLADDEVLGCPLDSLPVVEGKVLAGS